MKCFIASAFDKKDVDEIYDQVIIPTLKKYSIQPLRVDRIIHNEDIDDKIFSLINASDFCIADLTYSRPSVYYEAGFVNGAGKPVIYLARSDHFKTKISDQFGIYKIHFDLLMKNIIPWTHPNISFRDKLEKRILKVIKPIIDTKNYNNQSKIEIDEFAKLSQIKKQQLILTFIKKIILRKGYIVNEHSIPINRFKNSIYFLSRKKSYVFIVEPNFTLKILNDFRLFLSHNKDLFRIDKIKELHVFYLTLKQVSDSRLSEALPFFDKIENGVFISEYGKTETNINYYIHFVRDIKSIGDLSKKIDNDVYQYI